MEAVPEVGENIPVRTDIVVVFPVTNQRMALRSRDLLTRGHLSLTRSVVAKEGGYLALVRRECHTVDRVNCFASKILRRNKFNQK